MTLLAITLFITALLLFKDANRGLTILKRFEKYGPQQIKVKITGKKRIRFKRSVTFEIDRRLQKFLTCSFEIEGFHCTGYLPEQEQYQVGKEYFIYGCFFPGANLFLPLDASDCFMGYKVRIRKFSFCFLLPPMVILPPDPFQKPA